MNYIFMQRMGVICLLAIGAQMLAAPIQQIQVTRQTGSSCGYHAVYNAKSVETLALQGRQLTRNAIVQEARQYKDFIQKDALFTETIIDLANQLDMDNLYCVNGRKGLSFMGSSRGAQEGNLFLRNVVSQRQYVYPMIGHFIVNTGGHWVTFTVVKHPGEKPIVLYMDSMNTPLSRNRTAQAVGNALLSRLGIADGGRNISQPEKKSGRNRKPDNNAKKPSYKHDEESDLSVQKESGESMVSYKTTALLCVIAFLIGMKVSSSR